MVFSACLRKKFKARLRPRPFNLSAPADGTTMNIISARPSGGQEYDFVAAYGRREQQARLAGWLRDIGLTKQAARVEACCDRVQLALTPDGGRKVWPINHCHVRGCVLCGRRRAYRIAKAYEPKATELMGAGHRAQFVTLTIPSTGQLDKAELKQLGTAFNKLRRQKFFKGIEASVASLEVGHDSLNPHIHAMTIGERKRQWDWVNAWAQVSDGHITDCRAVDPYQLSNVLRYMTKPFEARSPAQLREFLSATARMQMTRSTGAFRGFKAEKEPKITGSEFHIVGVVKSDDPIIGEFLAGAEIGTPGRAGAAGAGGWMN